MRLIKSDKRKIGNWKNIISLLERKVINEKEVKIGSAEKINNRSIKVIFVFVLISPKIEKSIINKKERIKNEVIFIFRIKQE